MDARLGVAPRSGVFRAVDAVTESAGCSPAGHADRALLRGQRRRLATGSRCFAVMMVLAASAAAQASACDDFKAVLAARIEATGVRGYSLEAVPADDPVPPDAKVIATCESGTRKFLYRRWGAARAASSNAENAARAASAAQLPTTADAPARRAPVTREGRAPTAPPAATPAVVAPPVPRESEAVSALAATAAAPIKPTAGGANEVAAVSSIERTVVVPPASARAETATEAEATLTQRASGFMAAQWRWIAALALMALVCGIWIWRNSFSAYDKDGLPRGPKL
jgi:Protein of unknown function (DUF1161)